MHHLAMRLVGQGLACLLLVVVGRLVAGLLQRLAVMRRALLRVGERHHVGRLRRRRILAVRGARELHCLRAGVLRH